MHSNPCDFYLLIFTFAFLTVYFLFHRLSAVINIILQNYELSFMVQPHTAPSKFLGCYYTSVSEAVLAIYHQNAGLYPAISSKLQALPLLINTCVIAILRSILIEETMPTYDGQWLHDFTNTSCVVRPSATACHHCSVRIHP